MRVTFVVGHGPRRRVQRHPRPARPRDLAPAGRRRPPLAAQVRPRQLPHPHPGRLQRPRPGPDAAHHRRRGQVPHRARARRGRRWTSGAGWSARSTSTSTRTSSRRWTSRSTRCSRASGRRTSTSPAGTIEPRQPTRSRSARPGEYTDLDQLRDTVVAVREGAPVHLRTSPTCRTRVAEGHADRARQRPARRAAVRQQAVRHEHGRRGPGACSRRSTRSTATCRRSTS